MECLEQMRHIDLFLSTDTGSSLRAISVFSPTFLGLGCPHPGQTSNPVNQTHGVSTSDTSVTYEGTSCLSAFPEGGLPEKEEAIHCMKGASRTGDWFGIPCAHWVTFMFLGTAACIPFFFFTLNKVLLQFPEGAGKSLCCH